MPDSVLTRPVLMRRACWVLAAVSLAFGLWRSWQPDALVDFHRVIEWTRQLASGVSPYAGDSETDYPPWALLTLAPMLLIPAAAQAPAWIAINLGLAIATAVMLARWADEPAPIRFGLVALLLAASPFRVLGQFSLLSFALAVWGVRHPSPPVGGVLLGLALMKPQVGGVLLLAHLLLRDWRRVGIAVIVPGVLAVAAGVLTGAGPLQLFHDYTQVLDGIYGGVDVFGGHTDLETWLAPLVPQVATTFGAVLVGLLLLSPVAWRARHGVWTDAARLDLYAWCGVVSLLATRHLSYDLLLILPVVVQWRVSPFTAVQGRRGWGAAWWVTTVLVIVQIPGWWRRVLEPQGWPVGFAGLTELDRVLCVVLYGLLTWRIVRLNMTK